MTQVRKEPSQNKLKQNRVHHDQVTTETESSSEEYLGHQISSDGERPLLTKIEAIIKASVLGNILKLRSFLGLVN